MKTLFILLTLIAAPAFADTGFKLDDPAILGEYKLAKPDKNAEIQSAELIFNSEGKIVVRMDRGGSDYELSGPAKGGVVHESEDEFNCGGEESVCSFDASTVIQLLSAKNSAGDVIPQLKIVITVSYAWAEGCGGTNEDGSDQPGCDDDVLTFVLNWKRPLDHNVSFYTEIEKPAELAKIQNACEKNLKDIVFEAGGTAYLNPSGICSLPTQSFNYRESFEVAFPYLLKEWLGGNEKQPVEISSKKVSEFFAKAIVLARTYKAEGPVTSAMIVEELRKIEKYILKSDRFFYVPLMDKFDDDVKLFVVDSKKKIINIMRVEIK